ncbi:S8 family peptidase [Nonomuraea cavernae]|uniref:S8 family peptidase n=1 Tax=Nonomuraea cavernae TaxID=2045107 RepID=UPI0033DD955F
MLTGKMEPRLIEAIEHEKTRATAQGDLAADVDRTERFRVTISHQEPVLAPEAGGLGRHGEDALEELRVRTRPSQQAILDRLSDLAPEGAVVQHTLTNAVTTTLTPAQIAQVAELDEVKVVRLERMDAVTTLNESAVEIEVAGGREEFAVNGRGVRVAVLDSGVDGGHPALSGKVVEQVDTSGEGIVPGAHGTHVAGIIAGNDAVYQGVAYQSSIIDIKVLTSFGFGQPANVVAGLEQAVRRNADVVNLSLGWSEYFHGWFCDNADCILCQAADNAARLGVTVVVAAGNEGALAPPGLSNIRHPGAARRVITVASVDKAKQLSAFSSIGPGSGRLSPTSPTRLTKPDLAAPGETITSCALGGGFVALSGTSMAAPHVAGLAALMLERFPGARPAQVKKLLEMSAEPLPFAPNETGYGLVNTLGALMGGLGKGV